MDGSALLREVPYALLAAGAVCLGLYLANYFYDQGIVHWMSRKIGHLAGSAAYLLGVFMFSSWVWPVVLSGGFTVLLAAARLFKPDAFRGVGGTGRASHVFAECWFPLAGTLVLALGWAVFAQPSASVACICFMGIGDAVTGLVRSRFAKREEKHPLGSLACLLVCLLLAWALVTPFWVGAAAATAATLSEYLCGNVGRIKFLDDNLAMPLVSAAVVLPLLGR